MKWVFEAFYVGKSPCGLPEWAWTAMGWRDGEFEVCCSGPTERAALEKIRKMAEGVR